MSPLLWSAAIVGGAYLVGHVIRLLVNVRVGRIAARTQADWDDALVASLNRRIPFWSLLVGLYFALPYWPLTPERYVLAVRVLQALGVASVTLAAAGVATRLVVIYGPRATPNVPVSGLTQNLVRILITVLGALVIVRSFGYEITPMLTALGVAGLAVALAVQEPLSNLFAGVFVSIAGQVRIGDYIRLDSGVEGYVLDFTWSSTRLRQLGDNLIVVPNAKLAQAVVTNFSQPVPDLGIGVDVTVDWGSDLQQVERIALEVAETVQREVPGAVRTATPSVRFNTFTDTGIRGSIGLRVATFTDQFLVKHELVKRLHAAFAREGVLIAMVAHPIIQPQKK